MPMRVRSRMFSRSSWAKAERIPSISPPHGGAGIHALIERNKGHAVGVQHVLNQVQGVLLASGEPVQLVDDHMAQPPLLRVPDQPLNLGPVQVAAAEASVNIILERAIPLETQ